MASSPQLPSTWQRRPRIRPKRCQSSSVLAEQFSRPHFFINCADAETHGPSERGQRGSGLVETSSTRSFYISPSAAPRTQQIAGPPPTPPDTAVNSIITSCSSSSSSGRSIGVSHSGTVNLDPISVAAAQQVSDPAPSAAVAAASSVQPAEASLGPLFPPTQGIAIRHEYVLEMSKKSKRQAKAGHGPGGGGDIMDSLVSSIGEIESKQMRGLSVFANGHRRQRSESIGSVTSISPAPIVQTSKSSTRSPGSGNKLTRRGSLKNSARENDIGRHSLRHRTSQEHWLPPIEQEEDIFSVPTANRSYSSSTSNTSAKHPSIPARTSSMTHEIQIPPKSTSVLHSSLPPPIAIAPRSSQPRRSDTSSDIPSYITRYLRERTDSKENLSMDGQPSPRRPPPSSRNFPSRSRNSTTSIPVNDQYARLKLVTKRQSSQGFERDMSATRHYYSLPPSVSNGPRRSASLRPSRSSVASDGSTALSKSNSTYAQEVGDEHGWPIFCFTGMGLNRLVAAFYDEVATSFGLRIITPDRPGIGLSDEIRPSPKKVLAWADDITEICQALSIEHFSILGHSLGATYALAVALRLPERIRGRVHLLAPWIPLSQVNAATAMFDDIAMDSSCMSFPATHRFLRVLPVPIIKVAGNFLREKEYDGKSNGMTSPREARRSTSIPPSSSSRTRSITSSVLNGDIKENLQMGEVPGTPVPENDLVAAIWAAATRNSNATVDLLTSLERPHTVGFTYFDVTLPVVIRHGSKDERVPLERVMWMTKAMNMARANNAELKVIQGAAHGLMARADVMSDVFEEIARESHKWDGCIRCRKGGGCWLASNIRDGPPVPGKDRSKKGI